MSVRAAPSLAEGTIINGYKLGRCLGSGSMGEVYEAKHEVIGRRVAIKVLRADTEEVLNAGQRLLEEARSVNAIRHPGIVDVFDLGVFGERRPYLVMELLQGRPLSLRLKQGPVPFGEARTILEGSVEKIRHDWAGNEFEVVFGGEVNPSSNGNFTLLSSVFDEGKSRVVIKASEPVDNNAILRAMTAAGQVLSFNPALPSMNEIFIRVVETKNKEAVKN